jgi:hypothetical protein
MGGAERVTWFIGERLIDEIQKTHMEVCHLRND